MDNLRFKAGSFNLAELPSERQSVEIRNLGDLLEHFARKKGRIYTEEGFHEYEYCFGTLTWLVYSSYADKMRHPCLGGLDQAAHQLLYSCFMGDPGIGKGISDREWTMMPHFKCDAGLHSLGDGPYYSGEKNDWSKKRIAHFTNFPGTLSWNKLTSFRDVFLPNRDESDSILEEEILRHLPEYDKTLRPLTGQPLHCRFHEGIMKHKGRDLTAYAMEIGGKVCEANFYTYDEELSRAEQQASGSLRKIYRLLGKDAKHQYISIDMRHGMFEFHDNKGSHLGEFRFTCELNSKASKDHDLLTLK